MSSKISKKKKSLMEQQEQKKEIIERNQKEAALPRRRNVLETLTKWRMITYVWAILFPPYGLYRIWSKESTFARSEQVTWTLMIIIYVLRLLWLILFS